MRVSGIVLCIPKYKPKATPSNALCVSLASNPTDVDNTDVDMMPGFRIFLDNLVRARLAAEPFCIYTPNECNFVRTIFWTRSESPMTRSHDQAVTIVLPT